MATAAASARAAATATTFGGVVGGGAAAEVDVVVRRGVDGAWLADGRHMHGLEALREDPDRLLLRLGAHHVQRRLLPNTTLIAI